MALSSSPPSFEVLIGPRPPINFQNASASASLSSSRTTWITGAPPRSSSRA